MFELTVPDLYSDAWGWPTEACAWFIVNEYSGPFFERSPQSITPSCKNNYRTCALKALLRLNFTVSVSVKIIVYLTMVTDTSMSKMGCTLILSVKKIKQRSPKICFFAGQSRWPYKGGFPEHRFERELHEAHWWVISPWSANASCANIIRVTFTK